MIRVAATTLTVMLFVLVLALGVRLFGPMVERAIYPPIPALELTSVDCALNVVGGWVDKASYIGGQAAQIVQLNIYSADGENRLLLSLSEDQLRNRSAGFQPFALELTDGCSERVILTVKHRSPVTGLIIPSTWGPFPLDLTGRL